MATTNQFDLITYTMAKKYADRVSIYINANHTFADSTARNAYFAANSSGVVVGMYVIVDGDVYKYLGDDYTDDDDYQLINNVIKGTTGDAGEGVALGGTTGQALVKASNDNYDTEWDDLAEKIHNLIDTTNHPVTGLTTGHFLKATAATTYAFGAHGLASGDISYDNAVSGLVATDVKAAIDEVVDSIDSADIEQEWGAL